MSSILQYPHLTASDDGSLHIAASRYKVRHLAAEHYYYGWTAEELLRQHPDLRPEQVYAALTYFYDHFEQMVDEMNKSADTAERSRPLASLSREELLKRHSGNG